MGEASAAMAGEVPADADRWEEETPGDPTTLRLTAPLRVAGVDMEVRAYQAVDDELADTRPGRAGVLDARVGLLADAVGAVRGDWPLARIGGRRYVLVATPRPAVR